MLRVGYFQLIINNLLLISIDEYWSRLKLWEKKNDQMLTSVNQCWLIQFNIDECSLALNANDKYLCKVEKDKSYASINETFVLSF